jgi:tRNA (guanine37-N1)-methyltransferase
MGNAISGEYESHESGLLEHPHYTRPKTFEGLEIPDILLSGDHKKIEQWRARKSEELTRSRRPDLMSDPTQDSPAARAKKES